MSTAASFRRWLWSASSAERALTAVAGALILVLLGAALVPAPAPRVAPGEAGGANSDGVAPVSPVDGATTTTGEALAGASTVAGTPGSSGAPTAPGQSRTGANGPLTATDKGVTADAIKVGFVNVSLVGAQAFGLDPKVRSDEAAAIDALVDYANQRGGVLGRRIKPYVVEPVLGFPSQQQQECVEVTEDDGVFAVVDSFGFADEAAARCITAEHKTLLITGAPTSAANVRAADPYLVSPYKDDNRKMHDLAAAASGAGFFDRAKGFKKLGILDDECEPSVFSEQSGLKKFLRAVGVSQWSEFTYRCDPAPTRPGQSAVLQFSQDDVTHVVAALRPPALKDFLTAADDAGFHPKYFVGDYINLVLGGAVTEYDPENFDGALAVTETHAGEGAVGKPLPPLAQECSRIFVAHGLAPVDNAPPLDIADDIEVLELCENFILFLEAATRAGPNLTRASWRSAVTSVGDFRGATVDLARFGSGKSTGGDTMKLVAWRAHCTCWNEFSDFTTAAG